MLIGLHVKYNRILRFGTVVRPADNKTEVTFKTRT